MFQKNKSAAENYTCMTRMTLDEIARISALREPNDAEIDQLCLAISRDRYGVLDAISLHIAHQFAAKHLSYDNADSMVNHVMGYCCRLEKFPELMWSIYLAFDRGEYYHPDENQDEHPSERYTRPMILEILSQQAMV
jgi:hypothetical protein